MGVVEWWSTYTCGRQRNAPSIMARTSGWLWATRSRFMSKRKWLYRPVMPHGSFCSTARGWSAPTATELYQAANRSWPSGLAEGFSTSTMDLSSSSVCGSSEARS